ncbi:putative low-complexity protein [Xenococcus sp. PCC 7305]|uniref:pentapeptide repeat-containing protein n=1 Tax=Xenococcus sp. PCC 7305 TaxID=102125 RepID=UPI0002ACAD7F|nr:pentapeptide repeat-containing protein [Xenococcus sp. PCC 7305]ELS05535.1 putative low-complexity protein [Xenococcus sp. PCC 7305]
MTVFSRVSFWRGLFLWILLVFVTCVATIQSHQGLGAQVIVQGEQNEKVAGLKTTFFLGVSIWEWVRVSFNATVIGLLSVFLRQFLKSQDDKKKKKEAEIAKKALAQEKEIREERLRYDKLKDYLDKMTEVLLRDNTLDDDSDQLLKAVVRARTIVVLQELDSKRRGAVIRFLEDCNIIKFLDLSKANLRGANLKLVSLKHSYFRKADFQGANLEDTDFSDANLEYADLTGANLSRADLSGANLKNTIGLTSTQLKTANNWQKALYNQELI